MMRWFLLVFAIATTAAAQTTMPEMVKVTRGALPVIVEGEGVLEPTELVEIRIKPKVYRGDLKIKSIAKPLSRVRADETLLEIDDKPIQKEIKSAEAELEAATANLAKAKADVELQGKAEEIARIAAGFERENAMTALKWFDEVDGPLMLQQAELQLKNQQYALEDQNDELDQLRKMYKTEDLTSATADIVIKRSVRQAELTKIAVAREEKELQKVKDVQYVQHRKRLELAIEQQRNAVDQLQAAHAQGAKLRQVALDKAQRASDEAAEKLADLKSDAALFKQTSPVAGVLYYGQFNARMWGNSPGDSGSFFGQFSPRVWSGNDPRDLREGEKIAADTIVLTVIVPGRMRVTMDLAEANSTFIRGGMQAAVVPTSMAKKLTGKTQPPSPLAKSGGFELQIDLPELGEDIAAGARAKVSIDAGIVENQLLVPSTAVVGGKVTLKDGITKRVFSGRSYDGKVAIIDGLNEGDEIVKAPK